MLLPIHAGATLAMTGLIWFVQVVHYPLLEYAGERRFPRFASRYQSRTALVVLPLMLAELLTAILLVLTPPTGVSGAGPTLGLLLLAVIWTSTFLLQVPQHRRLATGRDREAVRRLVITNWVRTLAWTARSGLVLGWLVEGGP